MVSWKDPQRWSGWRPSPQPQGCAHRHGPGGQPALCPLRLHPPHGAQFPRQHPQPPTPAASPPWPRGDVPAAPASVAGTPWGQATYRQGEPAPSRVPLGPTGQEGGGGHRAAQHPATHLCPGGTRPPVGASGRCSGAGTRARWCLITGANEAAELHLHGARGTPRRTATAAARGHRCYRPPGTRTGGMAGLAPAPLRWGPGVGQAPRPQRGDTPPEQPGPVPAAGGPGDPWRFWLR